VTDSITLIVDQSTLLAVPNAFTPGNGVNNEFKILKRGIATLNYFRIFNRWGELIFETNNIDQGWNGDYKGAPQPFGVYVWMVEAVASDGTIFTKQGNVTLLR
jgi:gliding motility-associated-like protein